MPDVRWLSLAVLAYASAAHAGDVETLPRAIESGDSGAVRAALVHGDPNAPLAFGASPLAEAVYAQDADMVAVLLAHGAKPNIADAEGATPLSLACELGNRPIVDKLLDAHADVRAGAPDGSTALAVCARFGPAEAVGRMLAGGAPADIADARGLTPLMWAASSGHVETIALLLKAGAKVNAVSVAGFTPLLFAIKSGVPEATAALLAAGADAAHRGPENTSAAQLAAYQHNDAAVELLLAHGGVDVAERDREGMQLLHRAAAAGDTALVAQLLAKGADPNALTGPSQIKWVTEANFGLPPAPVPPMPPLLVAAGHGQAAVMRELVAAAADPKFVAEGGTNVVLAAIGGGSSDALAVALELAPDANVANAQGVTPLHLLVGTGGAAHATPQFVAMLKLLAAHGARADIPTKSGYTAARMAMGGLTEVKTAFSAVYPNEAKVAADALAAATAHGEAATLSVGRRDTVK